MDEFGLRLGPTGEYPCGRYRSDDQGGLRMAVVADPEAGKVMIVFGEPIAWLAMSPEQAVALAEAVIGKARQATGR